MGSVNMETGPCLNIGWEEKLSHRGARTGQILADWCLERMGESGCQSDANRMRASQMHPVNHFFLVWIT